MDRRSLLGTVLWMTATTAALPILVLSTFYVYKAHQSLAESARERALESVGRRGRELGSAIVAPLREVSGSLARSAFDALDPEAQRRELAALLLDHPVLVAASITDASGEAIPGLRVAARGLGPKEVEAHAALVRTAVNRGVAGLIPGRFSPEGGAETALYLTPLPGSARWSAAEASLRLAQTAILEVPERGRAYLVDDDLTLLAGPELERIRARERFPLPDPTVRPALARLGTDDPPLALELLGPGLLVAAARVPGTRWLILSEQPLSAAYRKVRPMYVGIGSIVLAVLALASVVAFVLTRRLLRPIHDLTAMAMEIAHGKFGAQAPVHSRDEIGRLAEVFNYMSQQLLAFDSETRRLYESLEEGYLETMLVLAHSIDTKDSYTHGHSRRVGELAAEIGKELGLPQFELRQLMYGGLLHDIGKIGIVEPILRKSSTLTSEEMDVMRAHPTVGAGIIAGASFLRPMLPAVRHHHERWDGTGYPDGLKGEEIPLAARIVGAADTWDACTSMRTYQEPMPPEQALALVRELKGQQLDPKVAEALERVIRQKIAPGKDVGAPREPVRSHG